MRAFAANGSKVAFVDLQDAAGTALAAELGALFIRCDITDTDALVAAIKATSDRFGSIGVLVNNAANDDRRAIDAVTPDYWDRQMDVNLKPQFFACQAVRPQMQALGGGSIINFSSIAWRYGADAMSVYATAKSATIGLSMALARGFGADNIRVNSIEPGAVMTERQRALWYREPADVDRMVGQQIIKQVLTGDHIARMVLFLAADDSSMITKQTFIVDAGMR